MHIREADMQLQLELMDGNLNIYVEFDKNWYKIWYTIVCEITSPFFWICLFFIRKLNQLTNRTTFFLRFTLLTLKKLIALFVNRPHQIKQANPKILDYISQTMVYYPKCLVFSDSFELKSTGNDQEVEWFFDHEIDFLVTSAIMRSK